MKNIIPILRILAILYIMFSIIYAVYLKHTGEVELAIYYLLGTFMLMYIIDTFRRD